LGIPLQILTCVEFAELTKVIENTHRFLEIAFAQELKMFCDDHALDFEELRASVNTKWNENIFEARQGIGGHWLPKDTQMYYEMSKHLLSSSTIAAPSNPMSCTKAGLVTGISSSSHVRP
jgi:UDP-N-acetyl-D-mannosaminuronic acid dehydrogenase